MILILWLKMSINQVNIIFSLNITDLSLETILRIVFESEPHDSYKNNYSKKKYVLLKLSMHRYCNVSISQLRHWESEMKWINEYVSASQLAMKRTRKMKCCDMRESWTSTAQQEMLEFTEEMQASFDWCISMAQKYTLFYKNKNHQAQMWKILKIF